jgi:anthranilate phosphoribosyltransferase
LSDPALGWAYIDQSQFCKPLHDLITLRQRIIKRQVVTTIETEAKPISGRKRTHFVTGYVHKPYPPIYAALARNASFDSALIIRGVEGGVTPSLRQPGRYTAFHGSEPEAEFEVDPAALGIAQSIRAVPLPDTLPGTELHNDEVALSVDVAATAQVAAEAGLSALAGKRGPSYDSLTLVAAMILHHVGKAASLAEGADLARAALDSGKSMARVK